VFTGAAVNSSCGLVPCAAAIPDLKALAHTVLAGYRVYYVLATICPAAPYGASQYFAGNPPAVPLVLTGLTSGQKYCMYLHTVDNAGNESADSNIGGPTKAK